MIEREHLVLVDERARLPRRPRQPIVRIRETRGAVGPPSSSVRPAASRSSFGRASARRSAAGLTEAPANPARFADRADDERGRGRAITGLEMGVRGEHVVEPRVRDEACEHVVVVRADRGPQAFLVARDRRREREPRAAEQHRDIRDHSRRRQRRELVRAARDRLRDDGVIVLGDDATQREACREPTRDIRLRTQLSNRRLHVTTGRGGVTLSLRGDRSRRGSRRGTRAAAGPSARPHRRA